MARVPVAEGVFTWPSDEPRLIGSRCTTCGNHMFPVQSGCPKCTGDSTERVEFARRGTLWTWTVQGFPPKAPPYAGDADPKTFVPFGVGYVELPGQVKVEARLTEADPAKLRIGMEMEMVIIPLHVDENGQEVVTFAFAPVIENGGTK
ncbi:MAG: Zn-ribbon domain-containing OB-fold protein [Actinomycetota bacterium]